MKPTTSSPSMRQRKQHIHCAPAETGLARDGPQLPGRQSPTTGSSRPQYGTCNSRARRTLAGPPAGCAAVAAGIRGAIAWARSAARWLWRPPTPLSLWKVADTCTHGRGESPPCRMREHTQDMRRLTVLAGTSSSNTVALSRYCGLARCCHRGVLQYRYSSPGRRRPGEPAAAAPTGRLPRRRSAGTAKEPETHMSFELENYIN